MVRCRGTVSAAEDGALAPPAGGSRRRRALIAGEGDSAEHGRGKCKLSGRLFVPNFPQARSCSSLGGGGWQPTRLDSRSRWWRCGTSLRYSCCGRVTGPLERVLSVVCISFGGPHSGQFRARWWRDRCHTFLKGNRLAESGVPLCLGGALKGTQDQKRQSLIELRLRCGFVVLTDVAQAATWRRVGLWGAPPLATVD